MATLDLGKIKLVNKGTWASGTTYTADDLVQYTDGGILSTYICVVASSQGHTPSSSGTTHASWNFLAKGIVDPIPSQSGNSGKALVTNGSAVSWGTAGKILQVVQEHDSSFQRLQTSSTTFVGSTHKVTITPTAANSKILVDMRFINNNNGVGFDAYLTIRRSVAGGTFVDDFIPNGSQTNTTNNRMLTRNYGGASRNEIGNSMAILDTPTYSLGESIEYKLYGRSGTSGQNIEVPSSPNRSPVLCFATEIAA
tara:strand:+ start:33 stop:791 length:759 start_codon:yes stop_codon:yes gene_type:complete